jgi:hypothetical protein
VNINSDHGRIGSFWWFNSNTKIQRFSPGAAPHLVMEGMRLVQWGACGFGQNVSITLKPFND